LLTAHKTEKPETAHHYVIQIETVCYDDLQNLHGVQVVGGSNPLAPTISTVMLSSVLTACLEHCNQWMESLQPKTGQGKCYFFPSA